MTMPETELQLEPLGLDEAGPRVVALGGGHGLAQVLEAVQTYAGEITAVVTVSDDGGSSGRISGHMGIPPPGDIRRCLLALSPEPSVWGEVFGYRFEGGDVAGHSLGNLLLAALSDLLGGFTPALRASESMLGTVGRVLSVADRWLRLEATIDGRPVEGQVAIARSRGRIERLRLIPDDCDAGREVVEAIAAADQLIIGPGSLYTSILSVLLVPGVADAIKRSTARRTFVMNLMTQDGETLGMSGGDHLDTLLRMGGIEGPGTIVAHEGELRVPPGLQALVVEADEAAGRGWELVTADLADPEAAWPQHDAIRLGMVLQRVAGS